MTARANELTADMAALALTAAARLTDLDPLTVFDRTGRGRRFPGGVSPYGARLLAAGALRAQSGIAVGLLARVCQVNKCHLSPSGMKARGIGTDRLLDVSELMADLGKRVRL